MDNTKHTTNSTVQDPTAGKPHKGRSLGKPVTQMGKEDNETKNSNARNGKRKDDENKEKRGSGYCRSFLATAFKQERREFRISRMRMRNHFSCMLINLDFWYYDVIDV